MARTVDGPVLMTGDASHTRFGWEHGVESGSYTIDHLVQRRSIEQLRQLAQRHPALTVYLGHQ